MFDLIFFDLLLVFKIKYFNFFFDMYMFMLYTITYNDRKISMEQRIILKK